MPSIDQLLPNGPVPDREQMLQEALTDRVLTWLRSPFFNICALEALRNIADDILGRDDVSYRMPKDFSTLHCVDFASLSPANRRAAMESVIRFVGKGEDVYGAAGWKRITDCINAACMDRIEGHPTAVFASATEVADRADTWALDAVASSIPRVFDAAHGFHWPLGDVHEALNKLRALASQPLVDPKKVGRQWVGMSAIAGTIKKMTVEQRVELIDIIEVSLGLNLPQTAELLGPSRLALARVRLKESLEQQAIAPRRAKSAIKFILGTCVVGVSLISAYAAYRDGSWKLGVFAAGGVIAGALMLFYAIVKALDDSFDLD